VKFIADAVIARLFCGARMIAAFCFGLQIGEFLAKFAPEN